MSEAPPNPYESAQFHHPSAAFQPKPTSDKLPGFCLVVLIIDLVFIGLRAIMVLFGIVGLMMMASVPQPDPMVRDTGIWEVLSGAALVAAGLAANILMLFKRPEGAYLAIVKVLAVLGNYAVAIWQGTYIVERFAEGSPERIGAIIGAGTMLFVRVALLALYIAAVVQFYNWIQQRDELQNKTW